MVIERFLSGAVVPHDILQAGLYLLCFYAGAKGGFISLDGIGYFDVTVGSIREKRSSVAKNGVSVSEIRDVRAGEYYTYRGIFFYRSELGWLIGLDEPATKEDFTVRYIENIVSRIYPVYYALLRCFFDKNRDRDQLTGCYTREKLFEHLGSNLKTVLTENLDLYVFYMDFNNFKAVNDALGHTFGDRILASVAEEIRSVFLGYGQVYRVGGDEFVGITLGVPEIKVKRIAQQIEAITRQAPCGLFVSVSVGVQKFSKDRFGDYSPEEEEIYAAAKKLIAFAESKMYERKALFSGSTIDCKNCPYYHPPLNTSAPIYSEEGGERSGEGNKV